MGGIEEKLFLGGGREGDEDREWIFVFGYVTLLRVSYYRDFSCVFF